jgi:choice-of-anchor B domain-containing protein
MKRLQTVLVCAVLLAAFHGVSFAAQCDTLPDRRNVDLDSMAVFQFQTGGASCWGWEAPDGRHYAIMGGARSVGFIDVQTMTIVDTVPTQTCSWRELKTYRNFCYVVSECTGDKQGMMIIDMSFLPDSVHYVGSYSSGSNIRSHCISIDTAKGYAYLVRQNYTGYRIVSLANPIAPVDVGSVTTPDLHDMTAFNDTVYAAEGDNSSFSIWNCVNKAAPQFLARVTIPGDGYVHNIWPTADRKFLATTEEVPAGKTLKIWNSQNLGSITKVNEYLGPGQIPHNAHVEGDYLFVAHYTSGLSILDYTYPDCPETKIEFDTYLANDNPSYQGCWGVYPHTNGSGWVYTSNIDGRLFIFKFTVHPHPANASFTATPRLASVPFSANFTSTGQDLEEWVWDFGDGGQSAGQNPSHAYNVRGVYDVSLAVAGPGGTDSLFQSSYIVALAETLVVRDTSADVGTSVVWDVNLTNYVPISQLVLPILISNIPSQSTLDSIVTTDGRLGYFESHVLAYDHRDFGSMAYRLTADTGGGSPPLPPGAGSIAKIYLTIKPTSEPGNQLIIYMPTLGPNLLQATTVGGTFTPLLSAGRVTLTGTQICDCTCHADPVCDGSANVQDVIVTINTAFRGVAPVLDPLCTHSGRTDVNCSGSTDIIDAVRVIDVAFRGVVASTVFCNPCD